MFLWSKNIVPGIRYSHIKKMTNDGPLHIHILKIDLKNSKINIRPELAGGMIGNIEKTSEIAMRSNAIAAVNGSFFEAKRKLHLPLGFMVIDGQVVGRSILSRTAIGIKENKDVVFGFPETKAYVINLENKKSVPIWGVNRPRKNNEVVIYTNEYGRTTGTNKFGKEIIVDEDGTIKAFSDGNSPIPNKGFVVSLHGWSRDLAAKTKMTDRIGLFYDLADQWKDVRQAITGGPLLVKDGQEVHKESLIAENFKKELLLPNSRTAIGISKNKELILVVVDRNYRFSKGVTYDDLSSIMKDAGAEDAIGLDGGHASTMYLNGKVVNYPMNGSEANVSNALLVMYDGWKLAVAPKRATIAYTYIYVPPSKELLAALGRIGSISSTTYVPRPEDYGMFGLYDIYYKAIMPVIPKYYMPASFLKS